MKKVLQIGTIIVVGNFFVFIVTGFFFVAETTRQWAELLWVVTLTVLAVLAIAFGLAAGITSLLHKLQLRNRIFPDENGNLPIFRDGQNWVNANLIGVEKQPHAWMLWQATNNRSVGSQARELFSQPATPALPSGEIRPVPLISAPGQSDVIDAIAEEVLE